MVMDLVCFRASPGSTRSPVFMHQSPRQVRWASDGGPVAGMGSPERLLFHRNPDRVPKSSFLVTSDTCRHGAGLCAKLVTSQSNGTPYPPFTPGTGCSCTPGADQVITLPVLDSFLRPSFGGRDSQAVPHDPFLVAPHFAFGFFNV